MTTDNNQLLKFEMRSSESSRLTFPPPPKKKVEGNLDYIRSGIKGVIFLLRKTRTISSSPPSFYPILHRKRSSNSIILAPRQRRNRTMFQADRKPLRPLGLPVRIQKISRLERDILRVIIKPDMIHARSLIIRERGGALERTLGAHVPRNAIPGAEQPARRGLLVHLVDGLVFQKPRERAGAGGQELLVDERRVVEREVVLRRAKCGEVLRCRVPDPVQRCAACVGCVAGGVETRGPEDVVLGGRVVPDC